jgi:hypothetical protein
MAIPFHNMLMPGGYCLFHWMKVTCDHVVVQDEILTTQFCL